LYISLNISSNDVKFSTSTHRFQPPHADAVTGLPAWFMQNGWASAVDSTADFLKSVCSTSTLCQGNWKWWLSHQVVAHKASACAVCHCKTNFPIGRPYQALKQCQ